MFKIQDGFQIDKSGTDFGIWTDPRDGQDYPYKKIGDQVWMLRNLAYGAKQGDNHAWVAGKTTLQSEGHAWRYEDQDNYLSWPFDRGAIYTLESLAWAIPDGWHIPSQAEMNVFKAWVQSKYGSSNGYPTKAIKTTTHWNTVKDGYGTQYPANGTDNFGFSLVSAGRAETNTSGTNIGKVYAYYGSKDQYDSGSTSYLWLSDPYQTTSRYYWSVGGSYNYVYSWNYYGAPASYAMGVRLIKDTPAASTEPEIESISVTIPSTGASDNKLATEKATKDYVDENAIGKSVLTTEGSILVAGADAVPGELAPGQEGQILTINSSGVPEWAASSGGIVQSIADTDSVDLSLDANGELAADVRISQATGNTAQIVSTSGEEGLFVPASELDGIITTEGDLIVGGASGVPEALSVGSQGQVLSVGSSGLEWTTPSTGTNWYLGAFTSAQRPASPIEGQYGYDTTIDCVIWYIGGYWKNSAGAIV